MQPSRGQGTWRRPTFNIFGGHLFRNSKPEWGATFNKFLLRVKYQCAKCEREKHIEKEKVLEEIIDLLTRTQVNTAWIHCYESGVPVVESSIRLNKFEIKSKLSNVWKMWKTDHESYESTCLACRVIFIGMTQWDIPSQSKGYKDK